MPGTCEIMDKKALNSRLDLQIGQKLPFSWGRKSREGIIKLFLVIFYNLTRSIYQRPVCKLTFCPFPLQYYRTLWLCLQITISLIKACVYLADLQNKKCDVGGGTQVFLYVLIDIYSIMNLLSGCLFIFSESGNGNKF